MRYADDFVLGFQYRSDAVRFMEAVRERFAAYELDLHPEKTRLLEFGRFARADRAKRGERRPETFDFLGFTHYCRTKRNGRFGLGRKPVPKRMRRTLKAIKAELRRRMHDDPVVTARWKRYSDLAPLGAVLMSTFSDFVRLTVQRKCPFGWSLMVDDAAPWRPGGPPARTYLLMVLREMPSSRAVARIESPCRRAC